MLVKPNPDKRNSHSSLIHYLNFMTKEGQINFT
jgi:hypothetical protein